MENIRIEIENRIQSKKFNKHLKTLIKNLFQITHQKFKGSYLIYCFINGEIPNTLGNLERYNNDGTKDISEIDYNPTNIIKSYCNSVDYISIGSKNNFIKLIFDYNIHIKYPEVLNMNDIQFKSFMFDYKCPICGSTIFKRKYSDLNLYRGMPLCSSECVNIKKINVRKESSIRMTENNVGAHNTKYHSKEDRDRILKKQSDTMKELISSGKFTPNITNSWAKSRCKVLDKTFRSSWEAMFYLVNQNLEYEKIRIPYTYNGIKHYYITDFQDFTNKIIYEIKPKVNLDSNLVIEKENAAKEWCDINKWSYVFISEDWIDDNIITIKSNLHLVTDVRTKEFINRYL